jgi:regulatory protein
VSPPEDATEKVRLDLVRYLRIRERSRQEVARYLRRRGHAQALIHRALDETVEAGLVDDRRFADLFLRDRRRLHPMSRSAVLRELRKRGVDADTSREALATCDPPWDDEQMAWQAAARRWPRWKPESRRQQAASFLARRGFGGGVVRATLEKLEAAGDEPGEDVCGPDAEEVRRNR